MNYFLQVGLRRLNLKLRSQFRLRLIKAWVTDTYSSATLAVATDNWSVSSFSDFWRSPGPGLGYPVTSSQLLLKLMLVSVSTRSENGKSRIGWHANVVACNFNSLWYYMGDYVHYTISRDRSGNERVRTILLFISTIAELSCGSRTVSMTCEEYGHS